jgi:hypothetical protein
LRVAGTAEVILNIRGPGKNNRILEGPMFHQTYLGVALFSLTALNAGMAAFAIARYPALFEQHSALVFVLELFGILLLYAILTVYLVRVRGEVWNTILTNATVFGVITGALELMNIGFENVAPAVARGPAVSIGFMAIVFLLWGIGGARTVRSDNSIRAGMATAILSAGICMLIAVAAGFMIEFFIAPPDPVAVSMWAEYRRSGWTDAHAFGLANTLDSGLTHLIIAPIVAMVFGGIGSLLARFVRPAAR